MDFGLARPKRAANTVAIKEQVAEFLSLPEDAIVMVTELQCHEPGCPPLETVIAVLRQGSPPRQFKLHKGVAEVTESDVEQLLGECHAN
ncbi:MAG: hypothetical protein SFV18_05530 [Bryobacteraceae bacterium]|nr:hypothetical protein [Bryobacteraceae bacterium]